MPAPVYLYRASLLRVIDADTYRLDIDLGFQCHAQVDIRLRGIDTPERFTETGKLATAYMNLVLRSGPLLVQTYKDQQSFARWVADVWVNEQPLAELLRTAGFEKVKAT